MLQIRDSLAADAVQRLGGIATRKALLARLPSKDLEHAIASGAIVRVSRGRYTLPQTDAAVAAAHALNAKLSYTSAALWHGWAVKFVPETPHITIPRKRRVSPDRLRNVVVHRNDIDERGIATSKAITLSQCLRALPDDEALAIADSALREGDAGILASVERSAIGAGSGKIRRIASAAHAKAANPFESVLRAIAYSIPGLDVEPQVPLLGSEFARPDLVDLERRIVLEADSFEWHGHREALVRDSHRYNLLVADGWRVLRFSWEQVMFDAPTVSTVLRKVVGDTRTEVVARWPS